MTALFDPETRFTRTTVTLRRWRRSVRRLPFGAMPEHRDALWELVSWYEAMCLDDRLASPAPTAGLDALILMDRERTVLVPNHDVVVARGAVRVAQELANCRLRWFDGADEPAVDIAVTRLELAMQQAVNGAARQLAGIPAPQMKYRPSSFRTDSVPRASGARGYEQGNKRA